MAYRIAQSHQYVGNDYWSWSAWIEPAPDSLDEIEGVTWVLHPTFKPSRVEATSRKNGFRLDTFGWGTFLLRAELRKRDGETVRLSRMLELTYPEDERAASPKEAPARAEVAGPSPEGAAPYVFVSYASEDAAQANAVRTAMNKLGVRVRDAGEIEPGVPFDAAVRKMIRESAGVLSLVGSDYASVNVISEMKLAQAEEKPVVALLPEGVDRPRGLSPSIQEMRFARGSDGMESLLRGFVGALGSSRSM